MPIIPLYGSLLTLVFVVLSVRTIKLRRKYHIGLGDAGNPQLLRAIRAHSNFAEYVPLALVMLFWVEGLGARAFLVHGLSACLLIGRVSHAVGVSREPEDFRFRVTGMVLTFTTLLLSAAFLVFRYLAS
jgi:uncharacterized membrane protein YecN with MAPEG domain